MSIQAAQLRAKNSSLSELTSKAPAIKTPACGTSCHYDYQQENNKLAHLILLQNPECF
jgi:hypothetical protein